ncbi:MAG TPA: hypothetical protein PLV92_26280, partial [Pirellulaceae bacterium]|nr:hypothetical protein [Pirellulaceae bacterium]
MEDSQPHSGTWTDNNDGTGGWIRFGDDARGGGASAASAGPKLGFDRDDWIAGGDPTCPRVYAYVFAERQNGVDADWYLDNFIGTPVLPDPTTLFVNTVGYDTNGGQWAMMRPNREEFRDQAMMDGITFDFANGDYANLCDSTGTAVRSINGGTGSLLYLRAAEQCFRELDLSDYEAAAWPWVDQTTNPPTFDKFKDLWWRRIEWDPITKTNAGTGFYLEFRFTAPATPDAPSLHFTVRSHPFDIGPGVWWNAIWPRLAIDNEQARRDPVNYPAGGWNDAGNTQAEGRSHGNFLSGLAHVLRNRRPELSTAETSSLVSALEFGCDWMMKLVGDNTDPNALSRWSPHENLNEDCDEADHSHYFNRFVTEAVEGHIWEEHHTRPRGDSTSTPPGTDVNDESNDGDRVFNSLYG